MSIQLDGPSNRRGQSHVSVKVREPAADSRKAVSASVENLSALVETAIIPRLYLAHRTDSPRIESRERGETPLRQDCAATLAELCVTQRFDALVAFVEDIVKSGAALEQIYLEVLTPAARLLGEDWEADRRSFSDVTVGLSRLHQLLHELSRRAGLPDGPSGGRRRALFAPVPGEQHTFGLIMINDVFQRHGWETTCDVNPTHESLMRVAVDSPPHVIGLTISGETFLDQLRSLIVDVRDAAGARRPLVIVGGEFLRRHPEHVAYVRADATAGDALETLAACDALVPDAQAGLRATT